MRSKVSWIIAAIFGVLLLLALPAAFMLGRFGLGFTNMMGRYPHAPMMFRDFDRIRPFGWVGMVSGGLIQLGVLVLVIVGIVWLVKSLTSSNRSAPPVIPPAAPAPPAASCPNCSKPTQSEWVACPYCGTKLTP